MAQQAPSAIDHPTKLTWLLLLALAAAAVALLPSRVQ